MHGYIHTCIHIHLNKYMQTCLYLLKDMSMSMSLHRGRLGTSQSISASLCQHFQGIAVLVVGYFSLCSWAHQLGSHSSKED